jgi:uridine kinase
MIGDRIIPGPAHTKAAENLYEAFKDTLRGDRPVIAIGGESGAGKSEIALELGRFFERGGRPAYIFQQDDYFFYPPKTNQQMRRRNIKHVGLSEVNLRLLDEHIATFKQPKPKHIKKPLVVFDEDRITEETIDPNAFGVGIVEGTYTTLLNHPVRRVFIATAYTDTKDHRADRARDPQDEFLENVLEIEHAIISRHRSIADVIVNPDASITIIQKSKKGG